MKTKRIVCMVLVAVLTLFLVACAAKEPITANEFITRMRSEGYIVVDNSSMFNDVHQVESYHTIEDGDFTLEFFVLSSSENARSAFNERKQQIEDFRQGTASTSQINTPRHNRFAVTYSNFHFVVSRIENTVVYIETTAGNRSTASSIMRTLGY